ncbi:bifunctional 4-hydroxy-2-oxoglutarate aldolase/2-dehydro-3-deoxy-phosphogluconate aldolase [Oceanimonas sp. CHS3-5]|uniref:bifunctional 4-hydroxy-2-oxoglutarate aldolase/2-dehydro-3-deoxy-phosphogluconate aldolase n=1 Tax=Oceanimonas sp. CHS3-5 TaxID=3068186 RepID=UPI00273DD9F0|nr:bifunctional 4-hydroxy-2-oxoglutarate aldolase/2-dehydro-3-deoxy-phosphogluconate aldolase [Oceanimonas sp. CHS3-5]MDP5291201.1 bifunctional 4-hydroxy-2-oxoglutarate aldolase/2-dehydro-3-deoxy-phosphogluconate aldolase [Oceanimonas sp. CHS3-5]
MTLPTLRIAQLKIMPVITLDRAEDSVPLGRLLADNGLPAAEITFRSAVAADAIRRLREAQPDMLISAGTVLNREQVQAAKQAGADFVVSPGFNPNTVHACQELDMPIIPGVNNPSTIEAALEMDLTTLKFFPAEASGGVNMIRALQGPFGQLGFMPTGGIHAGNIREYLALPGVIACGGSWMVDKALINAGNWDEVARLIRQAVALVQ